MREAVGARGFIKGSRQRLVGSEENSPILIAKMHILKLNPATLEVQRACPRKVLHLGVGKHISDPRPTGKVTTSHRHHPSHPTHFCLLLEQVEHILHVNEVGLDHPARIACLRVVLPQRSEAEMSPLTPTLNR